MSKYGAFSGPYFPVFSSKTRKYGPEKTPYLDTFHVVYFLTKNINIWISWQEKLEIYEKKNELIIHY